ncbi:Short-chain dehydrogenase TIC 32-like chloroplastic protein [Lachnellula suecica]|uniref:Short-chain dehydrogenase TIC 32-like chloroplastic protein n=1 Tax=Lachnellula suecica TaxID=602035 RepID=A0A8T9C5W6_9HELO|nr:Short-chain dehydrogenase TIC 32-like chloroplastic protein [Lachnellula suecica]
MAAFNIDSKDIDILKHFTNNATGKTFLITGASDGGIGAQVAKTLAHASPKLLILLGRTASKIAPVVETIKKTNPTIGAHFIKVDFSAFEEVKELTDRVHVLINNAGIMAPKEFCTSEDGVESQFAACYLGHFLLTNLLLEAGMVGRDGDTIVNVGSLVYQLGEVQLDDINFQDGKTYHGWKAYGQAKTALNLYNCSLASGLAQKNVAVLIAHPGVTYESKLFENASADQEYLLEAYHMAIERNNGNPLPQQIMVSLSQAAGVVLLAALNPAFRASGAFIVDNKIYTETKDYATDPDTAQKLWELSEKLVGQKFTL